MTRAPTEMELRCARALCVAVGRVWEDHDHNQAATIGYVRVVLNELRALPDDAEAWDAFAGDGKMWRERTAGDVFRRWLGIASPAADGK